MCTTGDTAHIDTIFKFLPHTRQHGCIDILHCCNDVPLGSRGHVAMVGRIPGLWHIPKEKKSRGVMSGDLGGPCICGWSFPDARPIQRLGSVVQVLTNLSGSGRDFRLAGI